MKPVKRKLSKFGNYSYMVTIPKKWVKHLKWRSNQGLRLELKSKNIVLRDFPNK